MTKSGSSATTVLVLMGGPDAERAVSLDSGRAVAAALRERPELRVLEQVIDAPGAAELRAMVERTGADVVFPCLHGPFGEGGPLQEMLELIGCAFVGSGATASALAMDKLRTKTLASQIGVQTPPAQRLAARSDCGIEPPLVLKPVDDGSSVDLVICHTASDVAQTLPALHVRRADLMAERYVRGREVTVGVVGGVALPVVEIIPAAPFYDYDAKYHRDDTRYVLEPDLGTETTARLQRDAIAIFRAVGARHLARVDFIVAEDGPWFLELNTMPGFTSHSLLPMAARHAGDAMPALCAQLVHLAREGAVLKA